MVEVSAFAKSVKLKAYLGNPRRLIAVGAEKMSGISGDCEVQESIAIGGRYILKQRTTSARSTSLT